MEEVFFTYVEVINYIDQIVIILKAILFMVSLGVGAFIANSVWGRFK